MRKPTGTMTSCRFPLIALICASAALSAAAQSPHEQEDQQLDQQLAPIIAAHRIFALPPDAAREVVARVEPAYLAVCGRHTLAGIGTAERAASLWGRLAAGDIPGWLEQVEETRDQPFVVYRVKR